MPSCGRKGGFALYLFADYSGAKDPRAQKRTIKAAYAEADAEIALVAGTRTRDDLVTEVLQHLRSATGEGHRVCLGFDHQFGLPYGLLKEIGLSGLGWRQVLDALVDGRGGLPPLAHASTYCRRFNDWCRRNGRPAYFYSATKAPDYGIPSSDPRPGQPEATYRLTERYAGLGRGKPKPFNRVGDNGSVGGQTLVGLIGLHRLLESCRAEGLRLRCWPFDGLSIEGPEYEGAHVLLEPYPTAYRQHGDARGDAGDATACVRFVRDCDRSGELGKRLDLSCLPAEHRRVVRLEGWIAGALPLSHRGHGSARSCYSAIRR